MPKKVTDENLLSALLVNGSVRSAAEAVGLSPNAVYKRLQNDCFRDRFEMMQDALLCSAAVSMADTLIEAVKTLVEVLRDEEASAGVRVSAADAILRHTSRYIEVSSIIRRIERLESITEDKKNEEY